MTNSSKAQPDNEATFTAQDYAELGFAPIRLYGVTPDGSCGCGAGEECVRARRVGKHPVGYGWQTAPIDAQAVDKHLARGGNVGLRMGDQPNGARYIALDEDAPGALAKGEELWGPLPETLTSRTGSGGRHCIYEWPAAKPYPSNKVRSNGLKFDVRGQDSQIVAAPSRNANGPYTWTRFDVPSLLPEAWVAALLADSGKRTGPRKAGKIPHVETADPDERTGTLLEALAPHWEAPGEATGRRQILRALGGYLARRGWTDEQIAAVARGLETLRPEAERVSLMVECARAARLDDNAAGWSTLEAWNAEAAAVIESVAKDPREPDGFVGVWVPSFAKMFERAAAAREAAANDSDADADAAPDPMRTAGKPAADTAEAPTSDQRTDLGNARRLVRGYRDLLRYFEARKLWYVWDGARWKADDTGEIMRAAKAAAESLWTEAKSIADDEKRKAAFAWAAKCQDRARLMNMIELAKSEPGIPVVASDLDAHPWLLNVQNGTLDLRTGELHDPDPALLMTKCCATHYDPEARSSLWDAFVKRTTGGDAELAAYIQRSLGYSLFGAWREKAFWFGYGPPDGAKSTLLGAIGDVLGDYHVAAAASTWMVQNNVGGNRGDVTRLLGARFVTSLEIRPGLRFDEELVKKVTGGDTIVAAGKYESEIQFAPTFALWMGANDRPTIRDDDEGMWSRMRCVPFTNPVPDGQKDPHLREKLTSEEHAPAVLAWLVAGCAAWQREGLGKCAAVTNATSAYRADMNRAGAFFEECCELCPGEETAAKAMRQAYEEWCKSNNVRNPLAPNALGQRLRALGATGGDDTSRRTVREATKAVGSIPAQPAIKDRFWSGVRLRSRSEG